VEAVGQGKATAVLHRDVLVVQVPEEQVVRVLPTAGDVDVAPPLHTTTLSSSQHHHHHHHHIIITP
jgi:hypothetical protein